MNCNKCNVEIADADVRVMKKGPYMNKPLCKKCFNEEKF